VGATLNWSASAFSQTNTYDFNSLPAGNYYVVGYALDAADVTLSNGVPVSANWGNGIYAPVFTITVGAASPSAIKPTAAAKSLTRS
jgi:hypothetical protein